MHSEENNFKDGEGESSEWVGLLKNLMGGTGLDGGGRGPFPPWSLPTMILMETILIKKHYKIYKIKILMQ